MLIIIPAYKKIKELSYTLLSLLQCQRPNTKDPLRIAIVNNYPPHRDLIEQEVEKIRKHQDSIHWEWEIVHRSKTLVPTENFFNAVKELAHENEIFLVHGDDDLFLPWSIVSRVEAIEQTRSDLILSRTAHSLWYLEKDDMVYFGGQMPKYSREIKPKNLQWDEINGWGPVFMGNVCYRYSKSFKEGLEKSYEWFNEQHWIDFNTRSSMIFYYIPFAVKFVGGRISGIDQVCVVRGNRLADKVHEPYEAVVNPGFISLCAYGILNNKDLGTITELDNTRSFVSKYIAEWLITFYFDRRIPPQMRKETFRQIPLSRDFNIFPSIFSGIKKLLKEIFKLKLLKTRIKAFNSQLTVFELISNMKADSSQT